MRYRVFALLSAVAAVMIAACRQEPVESLSQQSQVGQVPPESQDLQANGETPSGDVPETGEDPENAPETNGNEEPLLLLDDEPPLLLDDDGQQLPAPTGPVADNSRCHHCHLNYVDEKLAVVHARADIGCADCHGKCDEHIADESWASGGNGTPPELMYPLEKINPFCLGCHPADEIDEKEHEAFFADTAEEKYCTDCHGEHRLVERKCKWK